MFNLPASSILKLVASGGGSGTSYIQSIQPVQITIGASSTSATQTITSVNTSNAFIIWGGFNCTGTTGGVVLPRIELTNATTVTAYRNTQNGTDTITVCATVVEFVSGALTSVQQGTISMSSSQTSNTATISSVTTSSSAVFWQGFTSTDTSAPSTNDVDMLTLTNSTTVTVNRNTATGAHTVGYCVVQFSSTILNSVQVGTLTLTSSNTSDTSTISSVNTANTMMVYNGANTTISTHSTYDYNAQLTNSTTVTFTRAGTATNSRTVKFTVVQFNSGVLKSLQRGTTAIASATSASATISSVNTSKAVASMIGYASNGTIFNQVAGMVKLASATGVTCSKNTAGSVTTTPGWEVVEFM